MQRGHGGEICNFAEYKGSCYGYVQPPGQGHIRRININRLGAINTQTHIDGITVIWTATRPEGGRVIVGWYNDATVYRDYQKFHPSNWPHCHKKNKIDGYRVNASFGNVKLLSSENRIKVIPSGKGWMGKANIWYALTDSKEVKNFIKDIKIYINSPVNIFNKRQAPPIDQAQKVEVEKAAITVVTRYYQEKGYACVSVEQENRGWDLEATKSNKNLCIEVKGLSGEAKTVELTPNEYKAFKKNNSGYRLCIVTLALSDQPLLTILKYSTSGSIWVIENGEKQNKTITVTQKVGAIVNIS